MLFKLFNPTLQRDFFNEREREIRYHLKSRCFGLASMPLEQIFTYCKDREIPIPSIFYILAISCYQGLSQHNQAIHYCTQLFQLNQLNTPFEKAHICALAGLSHLALQNYQEATLYFDQINKLKNDPYFLNEDFSIQEQINEFINQCNQLPEKFKLPFYDGPSQSFKLAPPFPYKLR